MNEYYRNTNMRVLCKIKILICMHLRNAPCILHCQMLFTDRSSTCRYTLNVTPFRMMRSTCRLRLRVSGADNCDGHEERLLDALSCGSGSAATRAPQLIQTLGS